MLRASRWMVLAAVVLLPAAMAATSPHTVSQKDRKFSVAELTIKPGDKVLFKNDDDIIHNVFSASKGFEFNLAAQRPGTESEQEFKTEGVAEVRCAFHPAMRMTVTVKK